MAETHPTILVTGATGRQGGAVARHLRSAGYPVRALTRDPAKAAARELTQLGAEVVQGDLDDRDSLDRALSGVAGVFSIQDFWETGYDREVEQGVRLADAARAAGVQHFVYSSVGSAHRQTGLAHFESKWKIENHIRDVGLPFTILRPVFFMENWQSMRESILSGTLAWPLSPETRLQQVAVDDIGWFAATAFQKRPDWLGKEVDLAGDEPTMSETAQTFSRVIGSTMSYQQIGWQDFLQAAGQEYHDMLTWFEEVGYEADIPALRRIHPRLSTLEQHLRAHRWSEAEETSAAASTART